MSSLQSSDLISFKAATEQLVWQLIKIQGALRRIKRPLRPTKEKWIEFSMPRLPIAKAVRGYFTSNYN